MSVADPQIDAHAAASRGAVNPHDASVGLTQRYRAHPSDRWPPSVIEHEVHCASVLVHVTPPGESGETVHVASGPQTLAQRSAETSPSKPHCVGLG